jgi:hypothetical protein
VLRVFFIFFCLNFGRVYSFADVLAVSAAIICMRPLPETIHSDLQLHFFNNSCFVVQMAL